MTTKDLILSADPTIMDTIFCGQVGGNAKHKKRIMEKLHRFLECVRDIEPEPTGLLGLVVKGHCGYEMTVFSKSEINHKYDPNNPVLTIDDPYGLPTAEAKSLYEQNPFFARCMITDLLWEQALGIEVDPENIALCGIEYATCDVLFAMTYYGFTPEERIQRMKSHRGQRTYSLEDLSDPTKSAYHIFIATKIAEYKEVHCYMQRKANDNIALHREERV
jgi:hypothetical protein